MNNSATDQVEAHQDARISRLNVPGMRCAGCIAKIEDGLGRMHGVDSVRVNLSARSVKIEHDPSLSDEILIEELHKLGFESGPASQSPVSALATRHSKVLLRALAVAGFGMMNILLLSVGVWSGADDAIRNAFHWISAVIALPVVAYSGRPFFSSGLSALRHGRTNMDVPISIGVILATALSFHEVAIGSRHAYFDSAVMLLFFLLAGRTLDDAMRNRTRAGISALLNRMGKTADVYQADGTLMRLAAEDLVPGMIMVVPSGEALAADGIVIEGAGLQDNSLLTGESIPETIVAGDEVFAGSLCLTGPLHVRITAAQSETVIADIARLMDEASQSRSRYVRIADRASRLYAPVVHGLAMLGFLAWMFSGAGWHQSLIVAISVLIITCPCALGLAVPAAQIVASGALIRKGLLIKDGSALERLAEVNLVLVDKTGTLTLGEPRPDTSKLDMQQKSIALALAQQSRHPLSKGLASALVREGVHPVPLTEIVERPGEGIFGRYKNSTVGLGRIENDGVALGATLTVSTHVQPIIFEDSLRSDTAAVLAQLKADGLQVSVLSGDRPTAVDKLTEPLGITGKGGMTPADKLAEITFLREQGWYPLMVGDGINDGPALAAAHVSIAPGTSSDVSRQAADAVFIGELLMPVALAIKIARATSRVVKQNFGFAALYNSIAVPLALAGAVTPLLAAVAMSASSLIVVANSLRLVRSSSG